jgi:O-antigen/teichoic acid export membrane protein
MKYFPNFSQHGKKGLIPFTLGVLAAGFVLVSSLYLIFQEPIIAFKVEESALLEEYYLLIIPILLSVILYVYFQNLCRVHLQTVLPMFIYEFVFKIIVALLLGATYYWDWSLETFLYAWTASYSFNFLVLATYLIATGRMDLSWGDGSVDRSFVKSSLDFGLFNTMAGASNSIISNVDILMIGLLLQADSLEGAGIYAIMVYIGNSVLMPTRGLVTIASPMVSDFFEKEDWDGVLRIYRKTSLNQSIITGFLLLLIFVNLEGILKILEVPFDIGAPVFVFIGFARLFQSSTGVNGIIINFSEYYRWTTYFILGLAILAVGTNYLLIPRFGIGGAAMATFISISLYEALKWGFVWSRLGMQPFYRRHLKALGVAVALMAIHWMLPALEDVWLDLIYRSAILSGVGLVAIWYLDISPDLKDTLLQIRSRVGIG